jgi:hypothetical protein
MIFKTFSEINSASRVSIKDIEETYSWVIDRFRVLKDERRAIYAEMEIKSKVPKQAEFKDLREMEDFILQFREKFSRKNNHA